MSSNPRLKRLAPKTSKIYKIEQDMFLSPEERQMTRELLSRYPGINSTLLLTILETGARPQEALNLLKSDLLRGNLVHLTGLKDSNDRDIPVPADLFESLKSLEADSEGFLFSIKYRQLVNIWELYRPIKKPLKAMRHGFAVELYARQRDILLVKAALGHKSINNTLVYAHLVDGSKQLREALGL